MRLACKPMLLAALATATTTPAATSALAQTEPLTHDQAPRLIVQQEVHASADTACTAVTPSPAPVPGPSSTSGGCRIHVVGQGIERYAHLQAGGASFIIDSCNVEFDMRLDAAGEGYISHPEWTKPTGLCFWKSCGQVDSLGEGRAQSIFLREVEATPAEQITMLLCFRNFDDSGVDSHCEVTLPVTQAAVHTYRFTAADVSGHGAAFPHCELGGGPPGGGAPAVFNVEAPLQTTNEGQLEQRVEIRHS
jgi:hypothetical protein